MSIKWRNEQYAYNEDTRFHGAPKYTPSPRGHLDFDEQAYIHGIYLTIKTNMFAYKYSPIRDICHSNFHSRTSEPRAPRSKS